MSHSVRIALEAKAQIREISRYIGQDSMENARRWRKKLLSHLRSLQHFPDRNEIAYARALVGHDVRHTFFGNYRILYATEADSVVILTVRHGARKPLTPDELRGIH
jgi:toxin ParE1/3/4